MDTTFPAPVRTYITAVNAFDGATLITAFSDDAVVNDTVASSPVSRPSGPGWTARSLGIW